MKTKGSGFILVLAWAKILLRSLAFAMAAGLGSASRAARDVERGGCVPGRDREGSPAWSLNQTPGLDPVNGKQDFPPSQWLKASGCFL